ncbi:MAG: nadE [Parachlamydiales bacterium]|nr:nadE [Parachlamydiales bacterium]
MSLGYLSRNMRVLAAQLNPTIGDIEGNTRLVLDALERAREIDADIVVFPELTLLGYPPGDLLLDASFIKALQQKLSVIAPMTKGLMAIVGLPRVNESGIEKPLFNSAAIFQDGKLIGFYDKQLLPTYDVFDERRYFQPGDKISIVKHMGKNVAVTICEDLWQHSGTVGYTNYRIDPVAALQEQEVDLVVNLSASPYCRHKKTQRIQALASSARAVQAPLVLCNQVGANDQLVFDGHSFYLDAQGKLVCMAKGFVQDELFVDLAVRPEPLSMPEEGIEDVYRAIVLGIRDYFEKQGHRKAVLGLSGGIDSAVVACLAAEAIGAKNILALSLPSRFSSDASYTDAEILAERLGVVFKKISIEPMFEAALSTLKPLFAKRPWDVTEENLQARIRGQILMAMTNKFGGLLLTTGNKSEMAMGYMTIYGDMCGALAPLSDVTKTNVYHLARHINREQEIIPQAILQKMPTPELKANESYLDTLPPYEVLDPIIEDYIEKRLSPEEIAEKRKHNLDFVQDLVVRMHRAEFKRRQAPIGIRVTQKAFSKGRYVPVVQRWRGLKG